jgi:uncharacterized RDD family membrane protein YckC
MPQSPYPELLHPLSPGNTINAGINFYRARFKEYSGVALTTIAWLGLQFVVLSIVAGVLYAVLPPEFATLILLPIAFVDVFWCFGKFLAGSAAISRLAFRELAAESETAIEAKRFTNGRVWGFWLLGLVLFVLFAGVLIALYLALVVIVMIVVVGVGGASGAFGANSLRTLEQWVSNPATAIAFVLGFLILALLFIIAWTWIYARFSLAELPYGIEPETGAVQSIGRSWILTDRDVWHTVLISFTLPLVMIPLNVVIQIATSILQVALMAIAGSDSSVALFLTSVASLVLGMLGVVVALPLTQAVKGVMYYDLRNRREGINLHLRENEPVDGARDRARDGAGDAPQNPPVELFKKIKLQTPESVELELTLAGLGNRALARLIDDVLVLLGLVLFWFFGTLFATQLLINLQPNEGAYWVTLTWLFALGLLGTFLISAGYYVTFETLRQGQTPGKRYAQIRVIRDDGRPVGLVQSVLRSLLRMIDDVAFIVGPVLILFGENEKRLGDLVAGTLVIQEEGAKKGAIALDERAQSLAQELQTISDLSRLLPDDFAVIREFLQRRDRMTSKARTDLSMTLARQTRSLIQLETIPAGVTSDAFLEAVYLAYQRGGA